jgi:hypothetical protein
MRDMFYVRCVLLPLSCIPACILAFAALSVFCLSPCVSVCVTFKHPLGFVRHSIGTCNGVPSITHLSRNVLCVVRQCIQPAHWRLEHQPGDGHGFHVRGTLCFAASVVYSCMNFGFHCIICLLSLSLRFCVCHVQASLGIRETFDWYMQWSAFNYPLVS